MLRKYIHWNNRWRHVYIVNEFDQMSLTDGQVHMLEFKLSKGTKVTYASEKVNFLDKKPKAKNNTKKKVAA